MLILIDLLITSLFVWFLFWGFWPRYQFKSLTVEDGVYTLTVIKRQALLTDTTLVFHRLSAKWWYHTDGELVDTVLKNKLESLFRYATKMKKV